MTHFFFLSVNRFIASHVPIIIFGTRLLEARTLIILIKLDTKPAVESQCCTRYSLIINICKNIFHWISECKY